MPNLNIVLAPLPHDLQRIVWHEYLDRLRVRMLHYLLSRKFCHWRSLRMVQDITEYQGTSSTPIGFAYDNAHYFVISGWAEIMYESQACTLVKTFISLFETYPVEP